MHPSMQIPGEPFLGEAHGHGDNERHKKNTTKLILLLAVLFGLQTDESA